MFCGGCHMGGGNNFGICQWRVKTPGCARSRLIFGRLMMWYGEENRWVLPRMWKSAGADVRFWESEGEAGHRSPSTKKRQTPKWRQIGGAILTPFWWRELDLNQRPFGYEPNELPGCSIPRRIYIIAQVVSFGKGFLGLFWILEDFGSFGTSGERLRGAQGGGRGENEVKERR